MGAAGSDRRRLGGRRLVPIVGLRDFTGFMISWLTALLGSAVATIATIAAWRRLQARTAAATGDSASDAVPPPAPPEARLDRPAPPSLD